eukprot:4476555-Amphidinium_carterae.1
MGIKVKICIKDVAGPQSICIVGSCLLVRSTILCKAGSLCHVFGYKDYLELLVYVSAQLIILSDPRRHRWKQVMMEMMIRDHLGAKGRHCTSFARICTLFCA